MAVTVIAGVINSNRTVGEKALLAATLGYTGEAVEYSQSLTDRDPIRLYVEGRNAGLAQLLTAPKADPRTAFLYLLRLAEEKDPTSWRAWMGEPWAGARPTIGVVATGLFRNNFQLTGSLPEYLAGLTTSELAEAAGSPGLPEWLSSPIKQFLDNQILPQAVTPAPRPASAEGVRRVEQLLASLESRSSGPFLDGATYRAYFRGHFYSALYLKGFHARDQLASVSATREMADALQGSPAGTGAELAGWLQRSADGMEGKVLPEALAMDLERLSFPGEPAMALSLEDVADRLPYGNVRVVRAVRLLASHMDSRIAHQDELGHLALDLLYDLRLVERHYGRIIELAAPNHEWTEIWYSYFEGRDAEVLKALADTTVSSENRAGAIQLIAWHGSVADSALRQAFRRAIDAAPERWAPRESFVEYLIDRGDLPAAIPVVKEWQARFGESAETFDRIYAATHLAQLLDELGRHAEAWVTIEPELDSWQGGALRRGALVLAHLGRAEEAAKVVKTYVERYPDLAGSRATAAEVLWLRGADKEAAISLLKARNVLQGAGWKEVAESFLRVFRSRPLTEVGAAFALLVNTRVSPADLGLIPDAAARAGRADIAFTTQSLLKGTEPLESANIAVLAYGHLRNWKGREAAIAWARQSIPPELRVPASFLYYRERQYELNWDLLDDPGPTEDGTFAWLMRAAGALQEERDRDPHREQLLAHFRAAGNDPYSVMGKYLVGLADERQMLALVTSPDRRCEVAYYLGVRARSERRYRDATEWFLIARETEQLHEGEYTSALDQLRNWASWQRSLSVLAARP